MAGKQHKADNIRQRPYWAVIQRQRRHEACFYGGWGFMGLLLGALLPIALMPPHWPAYGFLMPMATFVGMFALGHVFAAIGVLLGGGRHV